MKKPIFNRKERIEFKKNIASESLDFYRAMLNDYEEIKRQQRLQRERTGKYDDPWKFTREKEPKQRGCNCKHDPARQKGTCGTCGGWVG